MSKGFDAFSRLLGPVNRAISGMIGRAILTAIDDATKAQTVQLELLADEVAEGVERFQQYGFTSVPHPECEAVVVFPGGTRSHGVVIATEDRRYRLVGLEAGEVALYDDQGQKIHLLRDGILIETDKPVTVKGENIVLEASADVSIDAGGNVAIDAGGDVAIKGGNITLEGDVALGAAGGAKVALVGDDVAGGKITGPGATKVKAT